MLYVLPTPPMHRRLRFFIPASLAAVFFQSVSAASEALSLGSPTAAEVGFFSALSWQVPVIGAGVLVAVLYALHRYSLRGMTHWTVGRRLTSGFALVLAVLCGLGVEAYLAIHHGIKDFKDFRADSATGEIASVMVVDYRDIELALKDIIIRRDAGRWPKYEAAHADLLEQIRRLEAGLEDKALVGGLRKIEQEIGALHALAQEIREAVGSRSGCRNWPHACH